MTPSPPTREQVPPPATVRALLPVAVLRVAVTVTSLVGSVASVPATMRRTQAQIAARTGVPPLRDLDGLGVVIAVFAAGFGLAYLIGWVLAARMALRGRRWAAVLVGALSAYGIVSGLLSVGLLSLYRRLPLALVVVVLLVVPPSRAWFRAMNPPAAPVPPPPWPPPPGYGPPGFARPPEYGLPGFAPPAGDHPPGPGRRH